MTVIRSPHDPVEIPTTSISEYVFEAHGGDSGRIALVDQASGEEYSYSDLFSMCGRTAAGLARRGFGPGEVLAVMAPNCPDFAMAFHGALMAGGVVTTLNPSYVTEESIHQLRDSGARWMVTSPEFLDKAQEAAEATMVEVVFVVGPLDTELVEEGIVAFRDLAAGSVQATPLEIDARQVAVVPYSSGTTGVSKGVELTHRNLVANLAQSIPVVPVRPDDRVVAVLPFFHIYGMQVVMNMTLRVGGCFVTVPRFDLEGFLGTLQDYEISAAYVVPPIVVALAKHPAVDDYDLSALRFITSGAAPLSEDVAAAAADRLGVEVVQGYGLTETSPVTHFALAGVRKYGSIGPLVPNTEARIVDAGSGEDLPVGSPGELWIRGPQVMRGYLGRPDATTAMIDAEGWLHTGDIAVVDDDGDFTIVDRLKELIKYKGFQVAPAELEAVLLAHPDVADAAVIGVPDDEAGEIPKAFIVLNPDRDVTAESILRFVSERVAGYKRIRSTEFLEEIPKSASGKILRRVLRDRERSDASS